jgi:hypothetical protein
VATSAMTATALSVSAQVRRATRCGPRFDPMITSAGLWRVHPEGDIGEASVLVQHGKELDSLAHRVKLLEEEMRGRK